MNLIRYIRIFERIAIQVLYKQLSQNIFFDPSTPSMRKGRDGEKNGKNGGKKKKKKKRRMEIVATTSLPAVDRPNADRWNAARSRQW